MEGLNSGFLSVVMLINIWGRSLLSPLSFKLLAQDPGMSVSGFAPEAARGGQLRIAAFTHGYLQSMFIGRHRDAHRKSFVQVCAKIFRHADADLLCCSEVGDFRQGFTREDIAEVLPDLCQAFGKPMSHSWIDNYAALWTCGAADERNGGASQPARVTLVDCQNYKLSVEPGADAAITAFDVVTPTGERYLVVVGNMHIVCTAKMFRTPHSRKMAVKRLGGAIAHACLRARDPCGARHRREQQPHLSPGHECSSERH